MTTLMEVLQRKLVVPGCAVVQVSRLSKTVCNFECYILKSSKKGIADSRRCRASHFPRALRKALERLVDRRQKMYQQFPFCQPKNSVVLFGFVQNNVADGYAARIWTYSDPAMSQVEATNYVTQAKKRAAGEAGNFTFPTHRCPAELNITELEDRIKSGHGTEFLVPANDSWVN